MENVKFSNNRKEKRWNVMTASSASGPWTIVGQPSSFKDAKKQFEVLLQTTPMDRLKLVRVVDLYSVLYPIS